MKDIHDWIMDSHYWIMDILNCELFIIELWIYTLGKKGCYTPGYCVFFVIIFI